MFAPPVRPPELKKHFVWIARILRHSCYWAFLVARPLGEVGFGWKQALHLAYSIFEKKSYIFGYSWLIWLWIFRCSGVIQVYKGFLMVMTKENILSLFLFWWLSVWCNCIFRCFIFMYYSFIALVIWPYEWMSVAILF